MSYRHLVLGAHAKLHDAIESSHAKLLSQFLGYEYPTGQPDLIYDLQEDDFTRELVNAFNHYIYWLNRVALWEGVLRGYPEDDALRLRYEFTTLPLDYCLHFPYKFKSQIVYCATQLCYTKAIAAKLITDGDVQSDRDINLESLKAVSHHWSAGPKLLKALGSIDAEQYRKSTSNYRNKAQHRHPQRLDFGHTASIVRSFPADSIVSYTFGEAHPLATSEVLPVLAIEAERLREGFFAYRALVEEHADIKNDTTTVKR